MTVIAWDGSTLAADRWCSLGGTAFHCTKVYRTPPEKSPATLLAFAGTGARFHQLIDWYLAGADKATYPPREKDDDSVLVCVVEQLDHTLRIFRYEQTGYPLPIEDQLYADGGGRDVALAALHCGKSAREAVELAAVITTYCGGGCDTVSFNDAP